MKNIKINLYLVAFYAILVKSLAFTLNWPEVTALSALLIKLGFDSWQDTKQSKETSEPVKAELKRVSDKVNQVENSIKLINFNRK